MKHRDIRRITRRNPAENHRRPADTNLLITRHSLPLRHERGGRNDGASPPFVMWIIGQVSGHKKIRRSCQCNREERLIIRVGQIQRRMRWSEWNTIQLKFKQNIPHASRIKSETGPRQDFRLFGQDALVMADLHRSRQSQFQYQGGISSALQ